MTRTWRHRQLGRGGYELEVTDADGTRHVDVLVTFNTERVVRPSLLIRRIAELVAEHHADTLDGTPVLDWAALGWSTETEHHELVADIAAVVRSWTGNPLEKRLALYVHQAKAAAGIPARPPYSVDQADELDRIVRRAPAIVAQDIAAEGSAA